ncbi:unnamed protein product [Effrenium voratum]|uniref:AV ZBD domain-containing protein n=1 Tax=Effrenium voratum TaxID=2562239 RepID=A0AA36J5W1_9DINO|nr:unnamed protein product [Effrenium voratum]
MAAVSVEDERVRYHARRFQEKQAEVVLRRYEMKRQQMDRAVLEKHAFHVACWAVALSKEATLSHNGLSVASVLSGYLEVLHDGQPLCTHLTAILELVRRTCSTGVGSMGALFGQIDELLPPTDLAPASESGAMTQEAVLLMQRAIQRWKNKEPGARESYVRKLEQELEESDDPAALQKILRLAVAALSPPRRKGETAPSGSSHGELSVCADLQARLRKLVLLCLDNLDLADASVVPALQCLQAHLQKFEELLASESLVASQRRWLRLQAKCAGFRMTEAGSSSMSQAASATGPCLDDTHVKRSTSGKSRRCEHGELRWYCRFCSGCPHGKAKQNCTQCCPCPHGKIMRNCVQCCGCPHGKMRQNCNQCGACPHGKLKQNCSLCSACAHGKLRQNCPECSSCPHGKLKKNCLQCSACPHGKRKRNCSLCSGAPMGRSNMSAQSAMHSARHAEAPPDKKDIRRGFSVLERYLDP